MQPRKRERQTDQTPLACGGRFPAQRELAKAQYLFDDANHGFDRAFAQPVDHLAERRLEFIRHLLARTRVVAGGCRQRRKAFVPTRVMRITPGGNVRLNPALLTRLNICGAKIPIVHRARFRWPALGGNRIQGRLGFSLIGRVVREREAHNQQARLIDRDLGVIVLLEAFRAAVLHNPRFGIGKVELILVAGAGCRWLGCAPARRPSGLTLFLRPLLHLGVILGLRERRAFVGPRLPDGFRFGQAREAKAVLQARANERTALSQAEYDAKVQERAEKERQTGRTPRGRAPKPPTPGPRDKDQFNFTDPESRIMKHRSTEGFEQDYNAQIAVDQASLLIVGLSLSNHPTDQREAEPTLDAIPPQIGPISLPRTFVSAHVVV